MKVMAVVKADAYGHGSVHVAREALRQKVDYLGVAILDEAIELRQAGIQAPILVLGYTPPAAVSLAEQYGVTLAVYSDEVLEAIARLGNAGKRVKVHIKVDTGMGRLGVLPEQAVAFIERALQTPGAAVEGLFTHYACADERDKTYTREQFARFRRIVDTLSEKQISFPYIHAGNSAAAIDTPELSYNMVRLGISMYGLYPSAEVNRQKIDLQPVMSFKTSVVRVLTLPENSGISYGATYRTKGEEQIATLSVGYADGYSRRLSGRAHVLIHGQKAPVVGTICMDTCMINVTGISGVKPGDEVVLFGRQHGEVITADELAAALGTIHYEVTCMVSRRVPRVYLQDGRPTDTVNRLLIPPVSGGAEGIGRNCQ
jgi:alanine racemase